MCRKYSHWTLKIRAWSIREGLDMIESKSAWKRLKKLMLENQILHNQFLDSFDQIFDLIHSYLYKQSKPNAHWHKAAQEHRKPNLKFSLKTQILKTYLQVDSSLKTYSISLPGLPVNDSSQKLNPILKELVIRGWTVSLFLHNRILLLRPYHCILFMDLH